ncbi:putative ribonuclease h protein [Fagus crenata]
MRLAEKTGLYKAESIAHALWECPVANDVWLSSKLRVQKVPKYQGDFITLVLSLFDKVGEMDCELVPMIMWYIWFNRNRAAHENKMWDPKLVVAKAESHLEEFIKVSSRVEEGKLRNGSESSRPRWKAPVAGMVKINWDVIERVEVGSSSRGIIIRDSEDQLLAAVSSAGSKGGDHFARRLLCLTRALIFAGEIGFFDVEIDIEDARLFHALSSKSLDNSRWGHLIERVRLCLQSCARWKLVKIPKFCNSAAKFLARMVKSSPCFDVWLEDYPLFLRDVILREFPL